LGHCVFFFSYSEIDMASENFFLHFPQTNSYMGITNLLDHITNSHKKAFFGAFLSFADLTRTDMLVPCIENPGRNPRPGFSCVEEQN
jgi:hypothetical protein